MCTAPTPFEGLVGSSNGAPLPLLFTSRSTSPSPPGVDKPSSLWDKTHGHDHDGAPRTGSGALATKTHGKTAVAFADLIWKRLDRVHVRA